MRTILTSAKTWRLCVTALLLFVVSVVANAYDFSSNGIYYNIVNSTNKTCAVTYRSTSYNSYSGSITIPETVTRSNGTTYVVVGIGSKAFYECSGLTDVTIGDSATYIESDAFRYCTGLTSVTIGNSLRTIGKSAFAYCTGLTGVTIGNSVTTINSSAFSNCTALTSITIPGSVTTIENGAFYDNISLKELILEDGEETLAVATYQSSSTTSESFKNCPFEYIYLGRKLSYTTTGSSSSPFRSGASTLSSVTLGESLEEISDHVFSGCSKLTSITIPNSVTTIGDYAFSSCSGLTELNIGNSVTTIGDYAFQNCSKLTEITIPNSVTEIGRTSFSDCSGLTELNIGNSVTSIGQSAFNSCSSLTEVTIPNSVTEIGSSAFSGCTDVTKIVIGENVTSIGSSAFSNCSNLTEVTIPGKVKSIGMYAFQDCTNAKTLILEDGEEVLSLGMTNSSKATNPFENCPIETLYLGRDLSYETKYGSYLPFRGNTALTSLTIGSGATTINASEFSGCTELTEITIGGNVISIASDAFNNCTSVKRLTLEYGSKPMPLTTSSSTYPPMSTSSSSSPFSSFTLETLYLDRDLSYSDTYSPFRNVTTLESLIIGENITTIEDDEFYGCSRINQVSIPDNIITIGVRAFYSCFGLTHITFGNSVTEIGDYAFCDCTGLTRLTLGESVASIGSGAFLDCTGLVGKLTIPESVTSIGGSAFRGCTGLTGLTLSESVKSIGSYAFQNCNGLLGNLTIPNSVTSMGSYAFYGCSELTGKLVIPDGITSIGDYTFYNCSGFSGLTIGEGVTSIGNYAFYGCTDLEGELTIPNQTNTIGSYAFSGCSKMTSLSIGGNVTSIKDYAFKECSGIIKIVIEDGESALPLTTNYNYLPFEDCPTDTLYIGRELSYSNSSYPAFAGRKIKSLTIGDNVTFIASKEFQNCSSLNDLTIGSGVETIGSRAFAYCYALTDVTIPEGVTTIGSEAFYKCELAVLYLYARLDSYKDPFTNMSCKTIYAHRDQMEDIQKYWSGTVLPLEMDYTLSVVSVYPRSVVLEVIENEGLYNNAAIDRVEVDGQTATADKDGLYVATGLMPNTSYVCKLYYNSAGSDYTDEAVVTTKNFADEVALQKVTTQSVTFSITLNEDAYSSMPDEYGFMLGSTYYPADEDGTVTITGLEAETEYTFTAYAKYNDAVTKGESVTVTTQEFVAPMVETCEATDITSESATLHGIVVAGTEEIKERGFEYWTEGSEVKTVTASGEEISFTLNDLTPGLTYFFRIYATTGTATTYGETKTFTTPVVAPTVQTMSATDITYNSATLNGTVVAGSEEILERGFEYWYADGNIATVKSIGEKMSVTIAGLKQDTKYTYRAYAKTASGTTYGEEVTFTTLGTSTVTPPTVQTYEATEITENSATLSGVVAAGSEKVTEQGFEYWSSSNDVQTVASTSNMSVSNMSITIGNLKSSTTYTYRAYAKTASGKTYGENVSFTTLGTSTVTPPTVQTYEATEMTENSATLSGVVAAGSEKVTEQGFEYWSSSNDVQTVASTSNMSVSNMSITIGNLKSSTTYTYRAYAKTASGTTYGENVSFTTLEDTDGVSGVNAGLEEEARYTTDGKKISKPQRGINIVRYSDGTTRKVLMK